MMARDEDDQVRSSEDEIEDIDLEVVPTKQWLYKSARLPKAPSSAEEATSAAKLAAWILAQAEKTTNRIVLDLTDGVTEILRLPNLRRFFGKNSREKTSKVLNLDRPQALSGAVGHLLADKEPHRPCQTCASSRGEGPFAECVVSTKNWFNGACSNCQYKSLASKCDYYKSKGFVLLCSSWYVFKTDVYKEEQPGSSRVNKNRNKSTSNKLEELSDNAVRVLFNLFKDEMYERGIDED
ncbi:hypothetical protein SEUCBS140593_006809 [Sporothrix eucalyptigena]|uniref:Uncharacterized protein n=1 Tax=Sporothrix eucalyptigena TaxID=1812306 RepID=A0ABP0C921_9PEZI